jgi:lysophospholipase L1-like esterase
VGGVSAILTAIHKKTPESKILLEAILPRGPSLSEPINEKIRQVNAKLATLANGKDVFFLDVSDKLVEPDGTISAEVMPDKLHVAGPGYTRWLEALAPVLENLLNDKK